MKCFEIMELIESKSPRDYACEWDNVGLLCGDKEKEIHHIYLALDATDDVIEKAIACGADMLITHHPLIFKPVSRIVADDFIGNRLLTMIQHGICYYAMHTNFDIAVMADLAANIMQLQQKQVLEVTGQTATGAPIGLGCVGNLPAEMTLADCAQYVKNCFELPEIKVFGDQSHLVSKAAILPGSGGSEIGLALEAGADVYITGDISHHEGIDAVSQGLCILDAGHYGIEHIFVPYMEAFLSVHFNGAGVEITSHGLSFPFSVV